MAVSPFTSAYSVVLQQAREVGIVLVARHSRVSGRAILHTEGTSVPLLEHEDGRVTFVPEVLPSTLYRLLHRKHSKGSARNRFRGSAPKCDALGSERTHLVRSSPSIGKLTWVSSFWR